MKAAVVSAFGETPAYEDFPEPEPTDGEVVLDVLAAGVHPVVRSLARGEHYGSDDRLPMVPGVDGVGVTEDGVHVYFGFVRAPFGTFAERAAVPARMCMPVPDGVDDATMAAIMNPGLAAWLALRWRGQLSPGETVLVNGATGASGQIAVQAARALGAGRIIATGRNADSLARLESLGADAVVQIREDFDGLAQDIAEAADGPVHVIVDYLWGTPTEAVLAAVTRRGLTHHAPRVRLIEVGQSAGATITLPAAVLRSSGVEIVGSGAGSTPMETIIAELPDFLARVAAREITVMPEEVALADVRVAWERGDPSGRRVVLVT